MDLPASLLTTKLYLSPTPVTILSRQRLLRRLQEGLSKPLTLISAPAGFGKTTLLRDWHASQAGSSFPLAWISLDHDDNVPGRFWMYLLSALRTIQPGLGEGLFTALQMPQLPPLQTVLTALINELAGIQTPFGLVLDDYQVITAPEVHESLCFLLDHLPPSMHLVVITRADPPLPLARLRARGQLAEIRGADLRFSPAEALAFLNDVMKLNLTEEVVEALETRTEGWIAGLHMAALSLSQQEDKQAFVEDFSGADRHVMDYLLEEVLQAQPAEVKTFLLKTSILERLCASLCDAVTEAVNSQAVLNYLEQANLFIVPLDNRRTWYRYHPLFMDLLQHGLRQELELSEQSGLVRRACLWYEREGMLSQAISQAISGPDYDYAANLLEQRVLEIFFQGHTLLLHRWLKALPEKVLRAHPLLCAVYANTLAHTSYFQPQGIKQAEFWLQEAEKNLRLVSPGQGLPPSSGSPTQNLARSFIALSRAYMALWRKEPLKMVIVLARHALEGLPPADSPSIDPNYLRFHSGLNCNLGLSLFHLGDEEPAVSAFKDTYQIGMRCGDFLNAFYAVYMLSSIYRMHGRLPEAAALCREVLRSLDESGFSHEAISPAVGLVYVALGQVSLERNELDAADEWITKGWELSRFIPGIDIHLQACIALANLYAARRDPVQALRILEQFEGGRSETAPLLENIRPRFWLAQGDLDSALKWVQRHPLSEGRTDIEKVANLTLIRVLVAQYRSASQASPKMLPDLAPALEYLDGQLIASDGERRLDRLIELHMLRALAAQAMQELPEALSSLRTALELAEPGGSMRLFLDEGMPMRRMLGEVWQAYPPLQGFISRLLEAWVEPVISPVTFPAGEALIEALSAREVEVLRLLAEGSSNAEISLKLYVSLNTTKKHVTHIFEKLGVANRKEAVRRAQELGLLQKSIH